MEEYEVHNDRFSSGKPYHIHLDQIILSSRRNWHSSVEFLYFIDGSAKITLNSDVYTATAGDVVVINSNTVHNITSMNTTICKYYCLIVSIEFLEDYCLYMSDNTMFEPIIKSDTVREIFEKIVDVFKSPISFDNVIITSHIMSLFMHLSENHKIAPIIKSPTAYTKKFHMIQKTLSYIRRNYTNQISVEDIAAHVMFSSDYLSHTFKEFTGNTIVYYINYLRCYHARSLLKRDELSISAIATQCGFNNVSYFTKTYKKFFGVSPSVFKAGLSSND